MLEVRSSRKNKNPVTMSSRYDRVKFNYQHCEKVLAAKLKMKVQGEPIRVKIAPAIQSTIKPK